MGLTGYTGLLLDRAVAAAGRRGTWWPSLAGLIAGIGLGLVLHGLWPGWVVLIPGLVMIALRPAGTTLRRRRILRKGPEAGQRHDQGMA